MKKCKYFNNHQTATSLMIDDLSPIYISYKNNDLPWCDWGYNRFKKNSLLSYFYDNFMNKFPEVRGTIFLPLTAEEGIPKVVNSAMNIKSNSFNVDDKDFFARLSESFDFAFHGLKHASYKNNDCTDEYIYESSDLKLNHYKLIKDELAKFNKLSSNIMSGGKFTGYDYYNSDSFALIHKLGFKWWAFSLSNNKKCDKNQHSYIHVGENKILDLPSNVNGNAFKHYLEKESGLRSYYYVLKKNYRKLKIEHYLDYLYSNQLVITIQEHFQNQALNGKIQTPNVFDDILSLEKIYSILRGSDIWHTTNSKLAHYLESFDSTTINIINNKIKIEYNGVWDSMFLSFSSDKSSIIEEKSGLVIKGVYKNNLWIYNHLNEGLYILD
mgnify:CR=1 FL=1